MINAPLRVSEFCNADSAYKTRMMILLFQYNSRVLRTDRQNPHNNIPH